MVCAALGIVLALGSGGVARAAAPGTLDSSFGSGGVVALSAGSQLFGVAVQRNGSVVAVGQSGGSTLVERLTAAGQPGSSSVSSAGVARAVALQSDGKVVVAGAAGRMFVKRLNADGSPDPSFASGGLAVAPLGASAIGNAVAVQPDGKIIVAGSAAASNPAFGTSIALARFNANGSLDPSFGSGGAKVVDFGLPYAAAQGVAVQGDGKIVFVGYEQGSTSYAFFNGLVGRLNSNGSLDTSFAGSGVYSYHKSGGGYDSFNAVALQNDGKIVAGGVDVESSPFALFLRLSSDGTPDTSFGSSGVATLSSGTFTSTPVGAYGVGIAGGGRVVGAGAVQLNGTDFRAGLWASSPAGSSDPSFGSGGTVEQQAGVEACALAIAPDGSLVIVGDSVSPSRPQGTPPCVVNSTSSAFVARYTGYGPAPIVRPPSVTTGATSAITEVSASVRGQVNSNGLPTTYHVDYGHTKAYGSGTPAAAVGSGTSPVGVSARLKGLRAGTTYHYRLVATNAAGTSYGGDRTFKSAPLLRTALHRLVGSYQISKIVRNGLLLSVGCNQGCSIKGSLLISAGTAKRLRISLRQIGSGSASLKRGGTARLRLTLNRAAKRKLATQKNKLSLTLRIVTTPAGGGRAVKITKTLTFKR
jgi:uncharacterized delta-60 repeat protein